ncbi:MAG: acetate kinase [Victivallales bacterium]|nr:acetate kinase [Victivallales bacterium]
MKVLVVNAGSSSLKFMVFDQQGETYTMLAKGNLECIGLDEPNLIYQRDDEAKTEEPVEAADHADALEILCRKLVDPACGVLQSLEEVEAIGHRVVHGGETFTQPVVVDAEVKAKIDACAALAPLHNPPNLLGITACEKVFPGIPNVAVFDTAFHQTMEPRAYLYAIPRALYEEHGIRKYGFHGTSHKYVYAAACQYLGLDPAKAKIVTCHLGNGCSLAAVNGGKVVDTTMGMTPLAGLMMGTRSGDLDPGVLIYMIKDLGMSPEEVNAILNKQSGLLGLGERSDMRAIIEAKGTDPQAQQAFESFVHRLTTYVGAYYALLGGADAVVLTGGIGENSLPTREALVHSLNALGCHLKDGANDVMGEARVISTEESSLTALVMPTNEELMIATETVDLIG